MMKLLSAESSKVLPRIVMLCCFGAQNIAVLWDVLGLGSHQPNPRFLRITGYTQAEQFCDLSLWKEGTTDMQRSSIMRN